MLQIYKENKIFILPTVFFWLAAFAILITFSKAEIHLFINENHGYVADRFFKNYTLIGDGLFSLFLFLFLLFINFRQAFILGLSNLISGIIAQILKIYIFYDVQRPVNYFNTHFPQEKLYLIPGEHMNLWFSFPSGHSTTAFALFFCFSAFLNPLENKNTKYFIQFFLFIMALAVGYSRMYLSQHFLIDVFAGSILGLVTAFFTYKIINQLKYKWLNRSFLTLRNQ